MKRRAFLASIARGSLTAVALQTQFRAAVAGGLELTQGSKEAQPHALPSREQVAWADLEIGMFVHFAPNTWQDLESDDLSTPLSAINPAKLDTDQWARTAVSLGAKYIVFVAKHQGGFCMWQTQTTDYSIRNTPWREGKGDVLADVAASCKKYGLKLGVYLCPRDDHFGARTGGICATSELQAKYNAIYREQLTEVISRYGDMVEVWFDGSTAAPVADLLEKFQPRAMVFQGASATIRWVGNEDGFAPNPCWNGIDKVEAKTGTATALNSDPDGDVWLPIEVDVSSRRPNWFWSTKNANRVLTVDQLMSVYYKSVGRGTQLLLNIPADRDGLLPDPDCEMARRFGHEVQRRFSQSVAERSGAGSTVSLMLKTPSRIDTVLLQEEISGGERIRAYKIEGRVEGRWIKLGEGTSVGHKRIQPVRPTIISAVRVTIAKYIGQPKLKRFALFDTGVAPPDDWDAVPQIWAANIVGRWRDGLFSLDLTKKITAAQQYRLRFVPRDGEVSALKALVLKLHEVAEPDLLKLVKNKPNELTLDITGVDERVTLTGKVEGAASGEILLQKL